VTTPKLTSIDITYLVHEALQLPDPARSQRDETGSGRADQEDASNKMHPWHTQ
jgi:hypothetical protein